MNGAPAGFVSDFLGAEHDRSRRADSSRPPRSYIVCSTPRSGSGLLCRGLAEIGAVGVPLEYFNPIHRARFAERWRCDPDLRSYIVELHARRSSAEGLFATKLHWDQLVALRAEAGAGTDDRFDYVTADALFDSVFPAVRFVRIVRLDRDRQAISYWRAQHSNVWSVAAEKSAGSAEPTPYDFDGIDRCRHLIENGELCWDRLIRSRGAEALVVTYEELSSSFAQTIERVTDALSPGLKPTAIPPPSTRPMSDQHSLALLERFRRERGSRYPTQPRNQSFTPQTASSAATTRPGRGR